MSKMGARIGLGLAAIAVVAVAGLIAFGGGDGSSTPGRTSVVADVANPAPDLALTYLDGPAGSLADLSGRPVVMNFFADWCPACVAEMPDFQAVHEQFGDDVVFVGMDRSTSADGARALIQATGITYDVAVDTDAAWFQAFEAFAMPTTVFIDAAGNIVDQHNGVIFEADLSERIDALFFSA